MSQEKLFMRYSYLVVGLEVKHINIGQRMGASVGNVLAPLEAEQKQRLKPATQDHSSPNPTTRSKSHVVLSSPRRTSRTNRLFPSGRNTL
jgi:hypothetical protein